LSGRGIREGDGCPTTCAIVNKRCASKKWSRFQLLFVKEESRIIYTQKADRNVKEVFIIKQGVNTISVGISCAQNGKVSGANRTQSWLGSLANMNP
jgi:hypothetical protein